MSQSTIPKDKDYPKLSKATSGYNSSYFCNDCLYFIHGNDCAIVKKDGPDVDGKESGIIAPYGICTLWFRIQF